MFKQPICLIKKPSKVQQNKVNETKILSSRYTNSNRRSFNIFDVLRPRDLRNYQHDSFSQVQINQFVKAI